MNNSIGFIGFGNMAMAMAEALIKHGDFDPKKIYAYAPNKEKLKINCSKYNVNPSESIGDLLKNCETVVVACKPYQVEKVLQEAGTVLTGKSIVSVAYGWKFDDYVKVLPEGAKVQCILPNTPMAVGEGVIIAEEKNNLDENYRKDLFSLFEKTGKVIVMPSNLIEAAAAISGCGPAFIDMVIEAMGDGGVKNGIPRDKVYDLVCQTMIGAAKLQMDTGIHPGKLKDRVCSPGGTTIKGVAKLEKEGIRYAFISAIDACLKN